MEVFANRRLDEPGTLKSLPDFLKELKSLPEHCGFPEAIIMYENTTFNKIIIKNKQFFNVACRSPDKNITQGFLDQQAFFQRLNGR